MKYALFTGCTAKESTPELLKSTLAVADKLGIELEILDEASCCGAGHLQDYDEFLSDVLNARNIVLAQERGLDLVTVCNTSDLMLKKTEEKLKNKEYREKINEKLNEVGLEYKGNTEIKHFLYVLIDDYGLENIAKKIEKPVDLNIAPFYGCHIIKPSSIQNEKAYKPDSLEKLIKIIFATPVEYPSKTACCGVHVDLQNEKTSKFLTSSALSEAKKGGADMMVTPCSLCHLNLDVKQRSFVGDIDMPVLHLPQLLGLALGIEKEKLGLNHNIITPEI